MAPATQLEISEALPNGHLEGQHSEQLANGSLDLQPGKGSKKLSASEKRRLRRKDNKKRAAFE